MKVNRCPKNGAAQSGSILVTTLIIAALICMALVAYLGLLDAQNRFTRRSLNWSSALAIAEAGAEEALTHINSNTNLGADSWVLTSSGYSKTRYLGDGYYAVSISTSKPPVIVTKGYVKVMPGNNYVGRTVQITTSGITPYHGLVAKTGISMSGSSMVDSFDSSSELYSTNGRYDTNKATDKGYVAINSSVASALTATKVYGSVATGPGGSVKVAGAGVGDEAWVNSNPGTIQTGHFKDDCNIAMPDPTVPFTNGYSMAGPGIAYTTNFTFLLTGGDYRNGSVTIPAGGYGLIQGHCRWYVLGDFTISGSGWMMLDTNATLELYVGGKATVSGGGVFNMTQKASSLSINMLSANTITYSGSAMYIGMVYAPKSLFTISGGGGGFRRGLRESDRTERRRMLPLRHLSLHRRQLLRRQFLGRTLVGRDGEPGGALL